MRSGDAVVVAVSERVENVCWLSVYSMHVAPAMDGYDVTLDRAGIVECTPAAAARALMGSERVRLDNAHAVILARGEPAGSRAASLRRAWKGLAGCGEHDPMLDVLASERVAQQLLDEQRVEAGFEAGVGAELGL